MGTGGLALWAMRIARYYWPTDREKLKIVVACIRDEGISIAIDELKLVFLYMKVTMLGINVHKLYYLFYYKNHL